MTTNRFNELLEARINLIRIVLGTKAGEYATDDRLHSFKEAAKTFETTPSDACWFYMMKHLVSIKDIAQGRKPLDPKVFEEKIGDAINYLILMEAIFMEEVDAFVTEGEAKCHQ